MSTQTGQIVCESLDDKFVSIRKRNDTIVFFDLDDTILNTNSFHEFIKYELRNSRIPRLLKILSSLLLRKLRIISSSELKNRILFSHKGKSKQDIDQYFLCFYLLLRKHYDQTIVLLIQRYIQKNYKVIIITGALYEYAVHIAKELQVLDIFATKLKFEGSIFSGVIEEPEMLGANKKLFVENSTFKGKKIIFYTDSYIDKPMLEYCYKGYIVSLENKKNKIRFYRKNVENKIKRY